MKNLFSIIILLVLSSCVWPTSPHPSEFQGRERGGKLNGVYDLSIPDSRVESYVNMLKARIMARDYYRISQMVEYPIFVMINGKKEDIESDDEFIKYCRQIITKRVADSILDTNFDNMMVNAKGFGTKDGEVWFAIPEPGKNTRFKIIAINN